MERRRGALTLLVVAALAVAGAPTLVGAQQTTECKPLNGTQVCIEETSVTDDTLEDGQQGELTVTVQNVGEGNASVQILLNTVDPDNETQSFILDERTLEPNESVTITKKLGAQTPGTHGLQVRLSQRNGSFVYDASKIVTVQVVEDRTRLGGELDAPEFALIALIGSLAAMGYLVVKRR
jgi:hypothetical protein